MNEIELHRKNMIVMLFQVYLFGFLSCFVVAQAKAEIPEESLRYAQGLSKAFEAVAHMITPSVVNISSVKRVRGDRRGRPSMPDPFFEPFKDFFGEDFMDRFGGDQFGGQDGFAQQGLGTGVIVDDKGHILTNNHVVGEADEVTVRFKDNDTYKAKIVGSDPRTDLAVIKVDARDLNPAQLGNSDELKIGEWVVAAGNPFGLDNTITAGIVSAKGRSIMGGGQYEDFIQTDAAINPGNSGGPLVNLKGEVVGINTAIFSRSGGYMGIGFAIPINMAKNVMDALITKGKVVRGWLGVAIQDLTHELAESFNYPSTEGALVGQVEEGGPAQEAGLKQGDIIVKLDEKTIKNINQLRNLVANVQPGKKIEVEFLRNGRKQGTTVKVGELPSKQQEDLVQESSETSDLGIMVDTLTPELARRLRTKREKGVVVRSVEPGGPAETAGIQPRDIIISVNGQEVESTREFKEVVEGGNLKKGIRLVVDSGGMEHYVFLKTN